MSDQDFVETTMQDAGLTELDARGLMPLKAARARVKGLKKFAGFGDESDRTWAALLSLKDAAEFVEVAGRVVWETHPRGMDNIALFQRYGAGVFPWLATFYDADSHDLTNTPWCVVPLLLEFGTVEAFRIVWSARTIEGNDVGDTLLGPWMARHADVGFSELGRMAVAGDKAAAKGLKRLAKGRSRRAMAAIEGAVGPASAKLFAELKLVAALDASEILGILDEAAAEDEMSAWPKFNWDFEETVQYHAMRLVAARAAGSDAWGIALERLTGHDVYELSVNRYTYGSDVTPGWDIDSSPQPDLTFEDMDFDTYDPIGVTIQGPGGSLKLTADAIEALDLRPGEGTEEGGGGCAAVLVRAWLATHPGTVFPPVADALAALKVPAPGAFVVVTEAFAHVNGDGEGKLGTLPSQSMTYKSLVQALLARDAGKFKPGKPNTDWRLHLVEQEPEDEDEDEDE